MPNDRPSIELVAPAVELDERNDPVDRLAMHRLLAPRGPQRQDISHYLLAEMAMPPSQDILHDAHVGEKLRMLERPRDSKRRDLVGLAANQFLPAKANAAVW